MAGSEDEGDDYGNFEKHSPEKPVEQVKQTTEESKSAAQDKAKSVRDKAQDLKHQAGQKMEPVISTAKDKLEKLEGKRPAFQEQAKEMLDQAKSTVGKVVQHEGKDVVESAKRLATDEKAFQNAAHKVAEKISRRDGGGGGGGSGSGGGDSNHHQQQQQQQENHHQAGHPEFSDFSEMEEDGSDDGEGASRPSYQHHHPQPHQKRKKSPLGYFKLGTKYGDSKEKQQQQEQQKQGGGGLLGNVRSVFGQGSHGQSSVDKASSLAQKKLGEMRHVVDAEMDEAGHATAAEKKTQGLGLVQSFVCLCTCASSVHVSG